MLAAASAGAVLLLVAWAIPARAQAPDIVRGQYLFGAAGGCFCHTEPGMPLNSGGREHTASFGTVYATNITPDRETGIGAWTDDEIITAIRAGRRPDGERLVPVHPYPAFNGMAEEDLRALVAFLRSVPAVHRPNRPKRIAVPLFESVVLPAWLAVFAFHEQPPPQAPTAGLARGEYLVRAVGYCGECHTPRRPTLAPDLSRLLAGVRAGPDGAPVPNITPDPDTGIGRWGEDDIAWYLATGNDPDGDVAGGLMGEVIEGTAAGYKDLSREDLLAVARYLRSIPPVRHRVPVQ
jgi:mono/diheme cytochrome c family protein